MSYDDKHNWDLDSIDTYDDDDSYEPYGSRNDLSKTRKLVIGSIIGSAVTALLTSLGYGITSGIRAHNIAQTNEKITQLNAERQCLTDEWFGKSRHREEISRIDQEILDLSGGKKTR